MISIKKMHKLVFEERKKLSFIFVDYEVKGDDLNILKETESVPIEHIRWDCLSLEAQGYGVIQKAGSLKTSKSQTKRDL